MRGSTVFHLLSGLFFKDNRRSRYHKFRRVPYLYYSVAEKAPPTLFVTLWFT